MAAKIFVLSVGITLDELTAKINKSKTLGGYKNDFSKICKRTKKPCG